jgi:small subunit ribosomal protein S16
MIKLRLKKYGRKKQASYRIVVMNNNTKRDGAAIEELGFYNPRTKEMYLNAERVKVRLLQGAQVTDVVQNLIHKFGLVV